jgi:hypothetical protein
MPITEVCNRIVQLETMWGRDGASLRERLLHASTPASRIRVFLEMLLGHLAAEFDPVIQHALAALQVGGRISRAVRRSSEPVRCVLAAEQAYTDQVHLIHDFRDLADIPPSGYKPQRNNHVPIVVL